MSDRVKEWLYGFVAGILWGLSFGVVFGMAVR
jgi:hypothetical protein